MVLACILKLDFKVTVDPLAGALYFVTGLILKYEKFAFIFALKRFNGCLKFYPLLINSSKIPSLSISATCIS